LREFSVGQHRHWIINNEASGMPNFGGTRFGLLTRISFAPPAPDSSLYGVRAGGVYADALPVRYDHDRWIEVFLANWADGSPAQESYYQRITDGPAYDVSRAMPLSGGR
jgi:hypothetical protein